MSETGQATARASSAGSLADQARLAAKLARILGEIEAVPKRGHFRSRSANFDYVLGDDLVDAIRPFLTRENIFLLTSVEDVDTSLNPARPGTSEMNLCTITTRHIFVDGDTGATFGVRSVGQGEDRGPAAAAKALTSALKSFITQNFLIASGEDGTVSKHQYQRPKKSAEPAAELQFPNPGDSAAIHTYCLDRLRQLGADDKALRTHFETWSSGKQWSELSPTSQFLYARFLKAITGDEFQQEIENLLPRLISHRLKHFVPDLDAAGIVSVVRSLSGYRGKDITAMSDELWAKVWARIERLAETQLLGQVTPKNVRELLKKAGTAT